MQFSSALLALLSTAIAAPTPQYPDTVKLSVESSNQDINGQGLSNLHFGAGINGVLLTKEDVTYNYSPDTKQVASLITINDGKQTVPYALSEFAGDLIAGITGAPFAVVQDDHLAINGSDSVFYACSELNYDPYGYLKTSKGYGVGVYASGAPSVCEPIKIKVDFE